MRNNGTGVTRRKPGKRKPKNILEENQSIGERSPLDGIWLVGNDQCSLRSLSFGGIHMPQRRLSRLLDTVELQVLCGFEQHREVLCGAVSEIMDRFLHEGLSHDVGATIIIDAVAKAQANKMKGIMLSAADRPKRD